MKTNLKLVLCLSLILFSAISFSQNKNVNYQNINNPFAKKAPVITGKLISPNVSNQSSTNTKPTTVNGSFSANLIKENLSSENINGYLNKSFDLNQKHSFQAQSPRTDNLNFTHINFQQYYNGVKIDGLLVQAHLKDGKVTSLNGQVAEFKALQTVATISSENALVFAKKHMQVEGELLNEYPIELVIIRIEDGKEFLYKLVYKIRIDAAKPFTMSNVFIDATTGKVLNAVSLIAHADTPASAQTLYSGAQSITTDSYSGSYRLRENSRKIETYNATSATYTQGVGFSGYSDYTNSTTTWSGVPKMSSFTISSASTSWWYNSITDPNADFYIVIKDGANTPVYTANYVNNTNTPVTFYPNLTLINPPYTVELWDYDSGSSNDYGGSYSIINTVGAQSYSGNGNTGSYIITSSNNPALDVHWGMEKTFDFYSTVFGRNSYDGAGSIIKQFVNSPLTQQSQGGDPNNAFALPPPVNSMVYGLGDGVSWKPVVGLDVAGHEYTHMVINYNGSGGLSYQRESGALNESFADIFGTCIEFYSGVNTDWNLGEDVMIGSAYLRSLSNPNSGLQPQPDTYGGTYWKNPNCGVPGLTTNDYCGVHTNSGVQNYWFYLLSQGGSGTNDIGNAYLVTGIGITQARQIAYRNLTTYLTQSATYYDAYLGSLQSAQDLYGNPSAQYTAVRKAWYAVGIGNDPNNYCSGTTGLTAPSGTFTDGSGSSDYNINSNCKWIIAPPGANNISLTFTSFDTESGYDSVYVYDGNDETGTLLMAWYGNTLPPTINSTGGALYVKFRSDNIVNAGGWSANYTSTGITPTCNGGLILSTPTGSFNDGSGAGNYGNNQTCYWVIAPPCATNVTLSFSAFNTELNYDGIILYDDINATNQIAVLTGSTIPAPVTSTTGVMFVLFVSDFVATRPGFSANYSSTGSAYCSGTTTLNINDSGTITDGSGGNNYCNNQDCRWLIQPPQATSVTLYFNSFDLEPASSDGTSVYDAVEVYDGTNASAPLLGRFSGNNIPPSITSTSGSMYVKFYSDVVVNAQGWSAYYSSTTTNYCTGTTNLTAPSGTFSDGSASNLYGNNSNCSWLIQPAGAINISLSFPAFNTEANYDAVIVYDGANNAAPVLGQFTGTSIPTPVVSTGGSMYVEFLSDPTVRNNGWTANYNSMITGIDENSIKQNLKIYPNPSNGIFKIESMFDTYISADITDLLGKKVIQSQSLNKGINQIDASTLSKGVYLIKLKIEGTTYTERLIIN